MQPMNVLRRDPAPSRISYRIQRLWLTPHFRSFLRFGLPLLAITVVVASYFGQQENRDALANRMAEMRRSIEERPEFMVKLMAIDGASNETSDNIREIVPVDFPISSFDLDLPAMQGRIQELDAVARADIRIRAGGILQIEIQERVPSVVWRSESGLELLDATGHRVAALPLREARPDLPLLAGEGAERVVPEALQVLVAAAPIASRVRGLLRMGDRRWDLVLDDDQRILLPEADPVAALEQVMALEQSQRVLGRALVAVDMRNPKRPTLRLASPDADAPQDASAAIPGAINE